MSADKRGATDSGGIIITSTRIRHVRTAVAASSTAVLLVAAAAQVPTAAATTEPPIKLVAATGNLTLDSYEGEVFLDLGTHVVAGSTPFEVRVKRADYKHKITASRVVNGKAQALPAGLITDFAGMAKFFHVKVTDAAGKTAVETDQSFCPNGETARNRPDAPDRSPYPDGCPGNPFTLGSVWGIQKGWATSTRAGSDTVKLKNGKYTAVVSIAKKYRDAFGIPAKNASTTIKLTVRTGKDTGHDKAVAFEGKTLKAAAARPTGPQSVPKGPKPDLRPLPAWQIGVDHGEEEGGRAPVKDYLHFSATVWNAGASPLVLDGFRRQNQDLMDAYQYFYDDAGKQVGYKKTGTMEWDPRDGHTHWHFTDFASYRLLDAKQTTVVRSQKEAFCLAATDAVDYTVKHANWHPDNTDLHTACGDLGSLSVREVLDVGSGDTYDQTKPGQSFDIGNLKNGTYYIQVIANPAKRLYESNTTNNVVLRKVILGGTPGHRTVKVPPYQLINAP